MLDTESYERADGYLEVPSCIESLANSSGQLRQLALQACGYYAKSLLCYGYTSEPNDTSEIISDTLEGVSAKSTSVQKLPRAQPNDKKQNLSRNGQAEDLKQLTSDKNVLKSMRSIVQILPFLEDLSSFVERCLVAIESTIKRITYYLNLASLRKSQSSVKYDTLQLTCDVRLDAVFVALMDLMFAITSLDKTLEDNTNIIRDLSVLHNLLHWLSSTEDGYASIACLSATQNDLPKEKIQQLNEYIKSIGMTLGAAFIKANPCMFRQCIERVQHLNLILDKDKTQAGFRLFHQIFEEFLIFYSDYLVDISTQSIDCSRNNPKISKTISSILIGANLIPTFYMTSLPRRIFGIASLSILFNSTFQDLGDSKRVYRAINQSIQRTKPNNVVPLESGNSNLYLDEFLRLHMPKSSIEAKSFEQLAGQLDMLQRTDANLEFERLALTISPWLIKLKSEALDHENMQLTEWPKKQILILDQGLKIANEIKTAVRSIPAAYQRAGLMIDRQNLIGLYRLSTLLKSIQVNMDRCELFISSVMLKIEHFIRVKWRQLFNRLRKRQTSIKFTERKMDLSFTLKLSSIVACSKLLSSNQGRIVQSLCLSMLLPLFDQNEIQDLNLLMDLMRLQFHEKLDSFTDCNHLYWHIPSIGVYYNYVLEELNGATSEINTLHLALADVERLFTISDRPPWSQVELNWLLVEREKFLQRLSLELVDHFKEDYLDRICQELEIDLRLEAHRDLYLGESSDTVTLTRNMYDFKQILSRDCDQTANFYIFNHRINLHYYVERYLNNVCYDLTALAPHDWFPYDNMMNLARHKYGLKFVDTQLPAQSLDSGLDLLDITRNLALFASRYSYDLTGQLFIEKCTTRTSVASTIQSITSSFAPSSSNQLLNTIQSHHLAQSIQTHGYGTLDSAVNHTYQTLKRMINLFSRQLSDDKLRAVLQKEYQQLACSSTNRQKSSWTLSLDKAQRIAKQFRLNISILSEQNAQQEAQLQSQSRIDLDSIRQTVTQIGNLLAFVRLIKNGALVTASKSVDYVPDLDDLSNLRLSKYVEYEFADYEAHNALLDAAKNFDQCLEDYQENFSPKTNYSKIIVSLFSGLLSKHSRNEPGKVAEVPTSSVDGEKQPTSTENDQPQNGQSEETRVKPKPDHLELFFLLIPALTINYVDHLINCKERASSRSSAVRFGALLCDDGFAMGLAFLLTVLGQTNEYYKLDWLNQTCLKLRIDIDEVEKRLKDPKYEESLKQTSSMTLRRLNKLHSEYVALEHTLTCALLLFENFS